MGIRQLEENKTLVRRFYEEVVSTGNVDMIESFLSPDYCEVFEGQRHAIGIDGGRLHIVEVRTTYRDLQVTVDRQIAEGEWVVSCITASGTYEGVWLGIKPTGKHVVFTGVNIDRVVNGRIVEHGGAANLLGPLVEIGAIRLIRADASE